MMPAMTAPAAHPTANCRTSELLTAAVTFSTDNASAYFGTPHVALPMSPAKTAGWQFVSVMPRTSHIAACARHTGSTSMDRDEGNRFDLAACFVECVCAVVIICRGTDPGQK